jgi:hypothetical protein
MDVPTAYKVVSDYTLLIYCECVCVCVCVNERRKITTVQTLTVAVRSDERRI